MAQFTRIQVLKKMQDTGLVPLFYNSDIELCKQVLKACYQGGARLLEFTARGDFAFEIFSQLRKYALNNCPEMAIGVGSITDAGAASLFMQMGADFVVTPVFREDIARACNRRKVLWSPGCGSLSEIAQAEELGCELVKLFPGDVYGPQFVKGIKGPQPWTSIMPTGGVSPTKESLLSWFKSGVTCVGMGSKLISKQLLETKNYSQIEKNIQQAISIIADVRNEI